MIELTRGDLLQSSADALVNPVNCVGVMGKGLAAQFKRAFPDNFRAYAAACKRAEVQPGRMFVFEAPPRWVINFPTKRHWKAQSRLDDIEAGLVALVAEVHARGITSIAIPPLGCGLGGLAWADVQPRVERAFVASPARVMLYEYEP